MMQEKAIFSFLSQRFDLRNAKWALWFGFLFVVFYGGHPNFVSAQSSSVKLQNDGSIEIHFVGPNLWQSHVEVADNRQWERFTWEQAGNYRMEIGYPALPCENLLIPINWDGKWELEIVEKEYETLKAKLPPLPRFLPNLGTGEDLFFEVGPFYAGEENFQFPHSTLSNRGIQTAGNQKFLSLQLNPILYLPQSHTYKVLKTFKALIRPIENAHQVALSPGPDSLQRMLVILPDSFLGASKDFLDWKHRSGVKIFKLPLSQITPLSDSSIKASVQTYYDSLQINHLLLIGDQQVIPTHSGILGSLNDHFYTTVDGTDFLPDLAVGRFSAASAIECQVYCNKLLKVQSQPQLEDVDGYNAALTVASNAGLDNFHGIQMNRFFDKQNYLSSTLLLESNGSAHPATVDFVLNAGISWLFYIGHGTSISWSSTAPDYNLPRVEALANKGELPVVMAIGCNNNDLDYTVKQSFGETWMSGSDTNGASAYLSCTELCAFYYTDTLGKETLYSYHKRQAHSLGQALNFGKMKMYEAFTEGPGGTCEATMQHFLLLGDPSHLPWTKTPKLLSVDHPLGLNFGSMQEVVVSVKRGPFPIEGAQVCLSDSLSQTHEVVFTDANGEARFYIDVLAGQPAFDLVVSGYNIYPYQNKIHVGSTGDESKLVSGNWSLSPQPSSSHFFLQSNLALRGYNLHLYGLDGKFFRSWEIAENSFELPKGIAPGLYFVVLEKNGQVLGKRKLLIQD